MIGRLFMIDTRIVTSFVKDRRSITVAPLTLAHVYKDQIKLRNEEKRRVKELERKRENMEMVSKRENREVASREKKTRE